MAKEAIENAAGKPEQCKIQVVVNKETKELYDRLQADSKYKDATKAKLMEDMLKSFATVVYLENHKSYERELKQLESAISTIQRIVTGLIDDEAKAAERAKDSVRHTMQLLEDKVAQIPLKDFQIADLQEKLEKEKQISSDSGEKIEHLQKLLEDAHVRIAAAEERRETAEKRASELQAEMDKLNASIVAQMQKLLKKQ